MTEISLRGLGHRFLQLIVSLFILLCITFIIGRVMPTDPVGAIVGELADPKAYEAMRARLGLDLPLYQQFFIYLRGLLHGDFGIAILTGNPVTRDLAQAFSATFELTMARKDIRLMIDAAGRERLTVLPPLAKRMDEAIAQGYGSEDMAAFMKAGNAATV